jgi:dephospho-CoA kinase
MKPIKLVGVAGTAGAGKDTVTEIMCKLYAMQNLSSGDVVRAITRHVYKLPADFNPAHDQLYEVANYLRVQIDPALLVKICILQAQALQLNRAVITGLHSIGEAEAVRDAGGIIIGIDADPKVRYERIFARGRSNELPKTFEDFVKQDDYENRGISDSGPGRGIRPIIDGADIVINNSATMEELELEIKAKVAPLLAVA